MDSGSSSYDNRCRLCIAESRLSLQLFETEAIRIDIVDKIRSYLSINIAMSDGLPQQICYECLSRIELFHSYKQSCLESQHTLKHWNFLFCDGGSVPDDIFSGTTSSSALQERNRDLLRTAPQTPCTSNNISNRSSILTSPGNRKSFPFGAQSVPFFKHLEARSNSASSRHVGLLSDEIQLLSPQNQTKNILESVNLIHTSKIVNSESRSDTASLIEISECNRGSRAFSEPPPSHIRNMNHIQYETSIEPSSQSSEAIDNITDNDSSPDNKVKAPRRSRSLTRSPPPHFGLRTRNSGKLNKSKDVVKNASSKKVSGCILDKRIITRSKMPTASVLQNSEDPTLSSKSFKSGSKMPTASVLQNSEDLTLSSKSSTSGTPAKLSGVTNDGSLSTSSGNGVSKNKYPKKSILEIIAKDFAPSISETVKQRRRIISLNQSSTEEMRKKNVDSSYVLIDNVSDDDTIASLSETDVDTVSIAGEGNKCGNESDNITIQSVEESTKALLRILESDNENYDDQENGYSSDFYQSDIQNDDSNICRTPSGSQNPKSAYVRVEKLSPEVDRKSAVQSIKDYGTITPKRRPRKDKGQSNQYRLVKIVKDQTGKERFKCLKCGSLLSHRTYIKEHMKIHTGDKSFVCSICSKAFRNNYLLKSHMGVHTKERNFKCDICGHTFVQRDRLRSHLRLHSMLPCKCKVCGRLCTQKQSLIRHMRLHTGERPFKCDYCENTFADRTTWINHTRTHTGERPFKCPVRSCSRTFSLQVHVFSHVRSHIEDRPFQCTICTSAQFKTKQHLQRHMDFAHKELITEAKKMSGISSNK